MSDQMKKLSSLQKKSILLVSGLAAPILLYTGLDLNFGLLSAISAALIAGIMLATILIK